MTHEEFNGYHSKSELRRVEYMKEKEKQMTHDGLLAKIDEMNRILVFSNAPFEGMDKLYKALLSLRAVVELHKPDEYCCPVCGPALDICGVEYPCPTIQAIEKELK